MATFFQAWRRRQADRQAAEWSEEREEARRAVEAAPAGIRNDLGRIIGLLIEGPDSEVRGALDELWALLDAHPELRDRFSHLRVVDDAVEFLK